MGVFSEMNIDMGSDTEQDFDNVIPFEAGHAQNIPAASIPAVADFDDEAAQQAEADAAPAVLSALNDAVDDVDSAEDDDEEVPADDEAGDDADEEAEDDEEPGEKAASSKKKEDDPVEKLRLHEESEAKRKAEWEAKRQAKAEEEYIVWEEILAKADGDAETAAVKKIGADAERLTRRNMKLCVAEHIQTRCMEEAAFARQAMHPRKSFVNCMKYINRHAQEYLKQEMEANDEKAAGMVGGDVPDDLCYKWAEDYFMDMDAEEDMGKDEKFVPKSAPYISAADKKKVTAAKNEAKKKAAAEQKAAAKRAADEKAAADRQAKNQIEGQIALGEAV